ISNARISKSSGSEELDNAALVAVNNARPIGPLPVGMPNEVSVPVSFRITN
ncbi:TPA: energy transducer TonB, partial [Pasteurella multocida]|nr:energy transducer TonB [Pasteurella multocida]